MLDLGQYSLQNFGKIKWKPDAATGSRQHRISLPKEPAIAPAMKNTLLIIGLGISACAPTRRPIRAQPAIADFAYGRLAACSMTLFDLLR
jgi:hypothetical protein